MLSLDQLTEVLPHCNVNRTTILLWLCGKQWTDRDNKYVSGTDIYPHMPILHPHEVHISSVTFTSAQLYSNVYVWVWPASWPICPILGFWQSKVHKNLWSLPWMPMNHWATFDAISFILGGEIRNRRNTRTHKQTVTDISTPIICMIYPQLSAWVDKNGASFFHALSR